MNGRDFGGQVTSPYQDPDGGVTGCYWPSGSKVDFGRGTGGSGPSRYGGWKVIGWSPELGSVSFDGGLAVKDNCEESSDVFGYCGWKVSVGWSAKLGSFSFSSCRTIGWGLKEIFETHVIGMTLQHLLNIYRRLLKKTVELEGNLERRN
jgi:hypothetical protein